MTGMTPGQDVKNVKPVEGSSYEQLFGTAVGSDVVVPRVPAKSEDVPAEGGKPGGFDEYFGGSVTQPDPSTGPSTSAEATGPTRRGPSEADFYKMYGAGQGTGGGEPVKVVGKAQASQMEAPTPTESDFQAMYGNRTSGEDGTAPPAQPADGSGGSHQVLWGTGGSFVEEHALQGEAHRVPDEAESAETQPPAAPAPAGFSVRVRHGVGTFVTTKVRRALVIYGSEVCMPKERSKRFERTV